MQTLMVLIAAFAMALAIMKLHTKEFRVSSAARVAISLMFLFTGISHFIFTEGMTMMLFPFIPIKTEVIYITGLLEIVFSIEFLFPKTRKYAGYASIAFLVALLPSNIYAAINHIDPAGADFTGPGVEYLWIRIPLQLLFIFWIYRFIIMARPSASKKKSANMFNVQKNNYQIQ